jgi:FMN phosphatase YigB (HAD superfamily)
MKDSAMNAPRSAELAPQGITHVSFDVFGTCLVRTAGPPSGLYRTIGREIATRLGLPTVGPFAEEFIEWRSEAERRARRRSLREEVRLEEIWRELVELVGRDKFAGIDGPALEMEIERAGLRPVVATRDRIVRERNAGRHILFTSDSCLPRALLAEVLHEHGFARPGDAIHVSSEIGLMKRSGTLFRHVLATTPVSPAALHHIGDHPDADFKVPRRLGISAERFVEAEWKSVERLLLRRRPPAEGSWISVAAGLAAARVGQARDCASPSGAVRLVEKFLGPFLCVFGHWVLRQAATAGRERLYFASRDTQLLWRVCQSLQEGYSQRLDLRYLLVSRQAVAFPAIHEISPAGMPWLRRDFEPKTVSNLLHKCELTYSDCRDAWVQLRPGWSPEMPLESQLDWAAFWSFLQSPSIRRQLEAKIERRKTNALFYFKKEGLFDATLKGFVDFGWFLTCQAGLNRLLRQGGAATLLDGYYLGVRRNRLGPAEAGTMSAIFREGPDDLPVAPHLVWMQRHYLLEAVGGITDQPSVSGYGDGGAVEYVPNSNMVGAASFREIETAVIAYAATFGAAWKAIADDDTQLPTFLSALLGELFERPSTSLVHTLQEIEFAPDPGRGNSERLIMPYAWPDVLRSALVGKPSRGEPGWRWWPEASAAATPRSRRFIRQAVLGIRNAPALGSVPRPPAR